MIMSQRAPIHRKCESRHHAEKLHDDQRGRYLVGASSPDMSPSQTSLLKISRRLEEHGLMHLFLMLIGFRCINAVLVQTWFVPDEYWQSVEVAHRMVFHYGFLTWEWHAAVRGYLHPLLFAILFKILQLLHLDFPLMLIHSPHFLQSLLSAVGDLHVYRLAKLLTTPSIALLVLTSHLSNWFVFFTAPRTIANTMEMILTSVALFFYPWPEKMMQEKHNQSRPPRSYYLVIISLACIVRPTAAVTWIPLGLWHFVRDTNRLKFTIMTFSPICVCSMLLSLVIDRIFYGKWVIVQINFLKFNLFHDMAGFYGNHPWHWYMSQGFPVLLGPQLFLFTIGVAYYWKQHKSVLIIILWTIIIYSFLGHKEFRFIMAVLPMVAFVNGLAMYKMLSTKPSQVLLFLLLVTSICLALYTSLIHQRGTVDVMGYLRDAATSGTVSVMMLMPCHSTPYYSYIHANISMKFLECPPDLQRTGDDDEADWFYKNPVEWLDKEYTMSNEPPTHLVIFDRLENNIEEFLDSWQFEKCQDIFHSHFPEGRVGNRVLVFCRRKDAV